MKDSFANYAVKNVLETCDDRQLEVIPDYCKKVHLWEAHGVAGADETGCYGWYIYCSL